MVYYIDSGKGKRINRLASRTQRNRERDGKVWVTSVCQSGNAPFHLEIQIAGSTLAERWRRSLAVVNQHGTGVSLLALLFVAVHVIGSCERNNM